MHSAVYWVGFQGTDISVPYEMLHMYSVGEGLDPPENVAGRKTRPLRWVKRAGNKNPVVQLSCTTGCVYDTGFCV